MQTIRSHLKVYVSLCLIFQTSICSGFSFDHKKYYQSFVGCFGKHSYKKVKCSQQVLSHEILKSLNRRKQVGKVNQLVLDRAKHFLGKKKFDYASVINLMVFPIKRRSHWLRKFSRTQRGKTFGKIALSRVRGKTHGICRWKRVPKKYQEICRIKM